MKNSRISFFITKNDLYLNFERNKDKFILITGTSGSGKSTLATKMALEENAHKISMDLVFFHGAHSTKTEIEKKLVDKFKKKYPNWQPSLFEGLPSFEHEKFFLWANTFYDFIIDFFKNSDKKIIIEGGHFFRYIDINKIKDKKIIIKRTSIICCGLRRMKRTSKYYCKQLKDKKITLFRYIKAIIRDFTHIIANQIKWYKKINNFIVKLY